VRESSLPRPIATGANDAVAAVRTPVEDRTAPKQLPASLNTAETRPAEPTNVTPAQFKPAEAETMPRAATEPQRPQPVNSGAGGPQMRMVNSRRILLDYDLADVPKPEQAMLELWYTQDGKKWTKDDLTISSGSPYIVEVNKEGTYGFMMIARSPGEKSTPPGPGEAPQVWVEVDWTKPAVQLVDLRLGGGPAGRSMSLVWTATDNNLSRAPITLSYAESPEGPWKPFATGVENTGRYVWQVPGNVPSRVYVKVEAVDLVGNVGSAATPSPVQLP
jgi:hypothetical protein